MKNINLCDNSWIVQGATSLSIENISKRENLETVEDDDKNYVSLVVLNGANGIRFSNFSRNGDKICISDRRWIVPGMVSEI